MENSARKMYRGKLDNLLSQANIFDFFRMVWAVDALQDDRAEAVKGMLIYPKEAETTNILSNYMAHKWKLETLSNEVLRVDKKIHTKKK